MPSARAEEFRRVAAKLGFRKTRQSGSHERWQHPDGRAATIPVHGGQEIGLISQLGIDTETFDRLR
jgi:predicted RNA binding protein YcfA (HicA-like mRNA interferase family)